MKYDPIKNPNYVATVVRVAALSDLEGLDNLKAINVYGMQALVSKDVEVGSVGVLFSTEVQLSSEFASKNNLHRHSNLNKDPKVTGYLDDTRRVKAIKLRGHRSDSLFMPLSAFKYLGVKESDFTVGDVFDSINGKEILRKYYIKEPKVNNGPAARIRRVDLKVFPFHIDSENYWRNSDKIPADAPVVITQKLHGTSVRYGKVPVLRDLKWYEKIARKLGVTVTDHQYKFVVGSRKVVKSIDGEAESAGKEHFYAEDLWSKAAKVMKLDELVPDGYLIYGEPVGWTPDGQAIQKDYTYEEEVGSFGFYVYRVATVTPSGVVTDLSWPATKSFAKGLGLKTVPELFTRMHKDFNPDPLMDKNYYAQLAWAELVYGENTDVYEVPVQLSNAGTVDEGVCIRYDGPNGIYILKAKSPIFLGHESALLDEGVEDVESEESVE